MDYVSEPEFRGTLLRAVLRSINIANSHLCTGEDVSLVWEGHVSGDCTRQRYSAAMHTLATQHWPANAQVCCVGVQSV